MKKYLAALAVTIGMLDPARAADYPVRPVTIVVPFSAGASLGSIARIVGDKLAARLGQPFIIEFKAGASSTIGTRFVAQSKPDGYTLLVSATGPMSVVPVIYKNLPYDPMEMTPVAQFMRVPFVIATEPGFQGKTVKDLLELVKQNPGKYNFASSGNGTLVHLAAQMLLDQVGAKATHSPYSSGSQVALALMRGDALFSVANISTVSAYFADGRLKPLATTGAERFPLLPGLPTVSEGGLSSFKVSHYVGLFGPKGMPDAIADKLNAEISAILREPDVVKAFSTQGDLPLAADRAAFGETVRSDAKRWGDMARTMDLKQQ
ncbi:Bug family tripartite tricarboxylate transporter substrate binding protein [Lacisediminimonas profundi]|uniref:Bug family tripartite tricarboxylate transporter substrate binding protein n=1 Tax=Lacisediminimonas profundi TaxID=2603856 RepID=UPI00124AFB0F|nr:tripartite tricarboxylate transporter substrate-binding protein [Lacisediminimonas profundi]